MVLSPAKRASAQPTVVIVDDDASLCQALGSLFRSVGHNVQILSSGSDLLLSKLPDAPSCLVLDIRMPGPSGLELQARLIENRVRIPVVIMSGHGDIRMSVQALRAGAVDFLTKPFRDQDMLDAVARAIAQDRKRLEAEEAITQVRSRYDCLTTRERGILELVTSGLMNKQIAAEVGLSEITVKIHRGQVMKKMAARSLPDLVRMAETLKGHQAAHPSLPSSA